MRHDILHAVQGRVGHATQRTISTQQSVKRGTARYRLIQNSLCSLAVSYFGIHYWNKELFPSNTVPTGLRPYILSNTRRALRSGSENPKQGPGYITPCEKKEYGQSVDKLVTPCLRREVEAGKGRRDRPGGLGTRTQPGDTASFQGGGCGFVTFLQLKSAQSYVRPKKCHFSKKAEE